MRKDILLQPVVWVMVLSFSYSCSKGSDDKQGQENQTGSSTVAQTYHNPVCSRKLPDPTVIRADDDYFYLYATEDTRNVPIMKSANLVDWEQIGTVFTEETRPDFVEGGGIWAPDIEYINGQYVLYYSMSTWGGGAVCGVGVATADNPEGPFTNHGKLFTSNEIGVYNSIDPCFFDDCGEKYLIWGSFSGIFAIELTDDGLQLKPGAEKKQIVGTAYEGSYIFKRGEYYYYFGSNGFCCDGINSTYEVVFGRSSSLLGPYLDKEGKDLMDNNFDVLIGSNEYFVGNGHNSQIVQDDNGDDWMLYHGFRNASTTGQYDRYLMLSRIKWDADGWPYVDGNSPSISAVIPVFNEK